MNQRIVRIIGALVGIVLIGLAYGLIVRSVLLARTEQATLEDQIAPLEAVLAGQEDETQALPMRQVELATVQAEQATVEAELMNARLAFPSEVDSTEVLAHIVAAAAVHGADLRQLHARAPYTVTVDAVIYRVLAYDVKAQGELDTLSAFLTALDAGPVGTVTLDQVRLETWPTPTPPPPTPGSTPDTRPTDNLVLYQASLVVQVYVRPVEIGTSPSPSEITPVSPEERARQLGALLEQARQEMDWERVISLLLILRQIRPSDLTLEAQLVEAYVREGQRWLEAAQYEQAGNDFQAALALEPDNSEALTGMQALMALTPTPLPTPTATPTPTGRPPDTPTPTPSPTATHSPTPKPPTATPTPTATPMPYYVLHLSFGANTRYPDLGCAWFGFAGRVTDAYGYPVAGVTVRIWAPGWDGVQTTTTASGEYEQFLDNKPRQEQWLAQLYVGSSAVSDIVTVDSRADCDAMIIHLDWRRTY